jgi:4-amino-4-deoxy-L-arabinose transferase-like glycosyltransferase
MNESRLLYSALFLSLVALAALTFTLNVTVIQSLDEVIYAKVAQEAIRDGHWLPLFWRGEPFWKSLPYGCGA